MRSDRPSGSHLWGSRISRRRRSKVRIAIVCVVVAAIVGGAAAARAWRRSTQEKSARQIGLEAFERGEWDTTIRNLSLLVAREVAEPSELLAFAHARMRVPLDRGAHIAQAVAMIDRARTLGADSARCDSMLLDAYIEGGMLAEAQREAERVLLHDERHPQARRVVVHAYITRGRLEDAERVLRRAVELEPTVLANRVALARILTRRLLDEALGGRPDVLRAKALVDEISAWSREAEAPAGVGELAQAVALELGIESREELAPRVAGFESPVHSREEAELRAALLDAVGRRHDADQLFAEFRAQLPTDAPMRVEIARIEFRRAVFAGDPQGARRLLESELRRHGNGDVVGIDVALDAVLCIVDGRDADLRALIAAHGSVSREVAAWFDALRAALDAKDRADRSRPHEVDVVAEAALRLVEAQRALRSGVPNEALRRADDAVLLARGRFDDAEAVAIESLVRLGRHDEAVGRAERLVEVTAARPQALAWRLFCESYVRGTRSREAIIADARTILASPDVGLRAYACAAAALGAAGESAEAAATFAQAVEATAVAEGDCVALAECAVLLARAFNDMTLLRSVRGTIARDAAVLSDDRRWALAWIEALDAEHRGDVARALDLLRVAAGENRHRLAIAGQFGDSRGVEGSAAILRASLPEGAAIVAGTRAALEEPKLAVDAVGALGRHGAPRELTLARLRLAIAHPSAFDLDSVLVSAAEARRKDPLDVELLAGVAGLLLATSPPDPAQALAVLGDAIRLAPSDELLRERAIEAALLAGEITLAREHAEALSMTSTAARWAPTATRSMHLAAIAMAEGDGHAALDELDVFDDLKDFKHLEGFERVSAGDPSGIHGERTFERETRAMRAMALVLIGDVGRVEISELDARVVRVSRMIPRASHRALVVRCVESAADPALIAHLAAEFLHRTFDPEIASMARLAATRILEREGTDAAGAAIAAYRAAVACGDDALAEVARHAIQVDHKGGWETALRREDALARLTRDPAEARRIALELLAANQDDVEAALIAASAAIELGASIPADEDRMKRAPRSPEVHLIEARMALLAGRELDARRAARDGIELAARRAYVAFETRDALRLIAEMKATEARAPQERVAEVRTNEVRVNEARVTKVPE